MAALPVSADDTQAFAEAFLSLLEQAREERLSVSVYRFSDRADVAVEVHPASDFRAQKEGDMLASTKALLEIVSQSRAHVRDRLDADLGTAVVELLRRAEGMTVFINFYHPAGSEDSCRVEIVVPDPLRVVVNLLAPGALEAVEGALAALAEHHLDGQRLRGLQ